jgi:glc operon protein GlcG
MTLHRIIIAVCASIGFACAAVAQVTERQTLTLDGANRAIDAAITEARRLDATGVFAVVDDGGNLIALKRLDGTFPAGANVSIGKARTAALFKRPTRVFEQIIREGRTPMIALDDFTPLQGGVPIVIDGQVVGAIGVSGASSAQQDDELAVVGANAVAAGDVVRSERQSPSPTIMIEDDEVRQAFAEGRPLIETEEFKIHASRRTAPGQAEVHADETDLIYVLEGEAEFITGGVVVGGMTIGPEEVRGESIQGGASRMLSPGDVIIVPAGTPHWFRQVSGPLLYYVVKVPA